MNTQNRLIYLPLGGAGEIGLNCYVYGYGPVDQERLIVVDIGVTFPDMDGTPGVELILPDIAWLAERADRIDGIFITHAHEDHVGALGHLWAQIKAPIYCRRFTAIHATRKMEEQGHATHHVHVADAYPAVISAGPFNVQFAPVSHSIPEASALVIDTPVGRIVHSGDFKIDRTPVVGEPFDDAMWKHIGQEGVLAYVCDSTNVLVRHQGRSEALLSDPITQLIADAEGMVVATTFASNVARLQTLANAGVAAGRSVCLMGRAMKRMVTAAVEADVLTAFPTTVAPDKAVDIPRQNLMLIVTGSQGERRAASAALARGSYLGHEVREDDLFLFSSKTIPGNEVSVARIQNALAEKGVEVVDEHSGFYHVSGHANRPDLEVMHDLLRPRILVPNHGEHRHLREHARLGHAKGMIGIVAENGAMVEFSGNAPGIVDHIDVSRTYLDGNTQMGAFDGVVRDRIKLALNGLVAVSVIVDEGGTLLDDSLVELRGLPQDAQNGADLAELIEDDLASILPRIAAKDVADDEKIDTAVKRAVRQTCFAAIGKKPEVTTLVSRLIAD